MALVLGTRVGAYEITAAIGAGGMGEVYRARDARLKRDVAIKILPEALATDPDRIARFEREAQVLASLNHPNIAAILGFEESNGIRALVLELVEGETLADRIARGPMPVEQALPIARQIADAMEAAHEHGVIHRDLKPANIKVTPDGVVKVLDFGLAKLAEPPAISGVSPLVSNSPTITSPAMMTGIGTLLGTAAYMAPEQAKGRPADKRSDIWAFGCVLYEMLTGKSAFGGDDISDTLAFVITRNIDHASLPSTTPQHIRDLIHRCLQKDPRRRLHDIADARIDIEDVLAAPADAGTPPPMGRTHSVSRLISVATGAVLVGVIAGGMAWRTLQPAATAPRVSRLQVTPIGREALSLSGFDHDLAITPDGSRIVYVGNNGTQLFVRALDALEPVALARGELRAPFISPDGQWVGYFENGQTIRKVALNGGAPVTVYRTTSGGMRGATWTLDDSIIFAGLDQGLGLQRISASGGATATTLTRLDRAHGEQNHWWPEMLPDGRGVLFTIMAQSGGLEAAEIAVLDLRTGTSKILIRGGSHARYLSDGYLAYGAAGTLRAVRFDLESLNVRGASVSVVPRVMSTPFGAVEAGIATDGTLVYLSGGFAAGATQALVWIDRAGHKTRLPLPEHTYGYPRLSPDGTRILVMSPDQDYDLWLWDLRRSSLARATFSPAQDSFPVWAPDGKRIVFVSGRTGPQNIFQQAADGTGTPEQLTKGVSGGANPSSVSADGKGVIFSVNDPTNGLDIFLLHFDGTGRVEPLVRTPANERNGEISPDGRWLAYQSDESGEPEIYVRPFPAVDSGRWQISTSGGTRPLWSRSGEELFYLSPADSSLMHVVVERGTTWAARAPSKLLDSPVPYIATYAGRTYDVSADGQRFLMPDYLTPPDSARGPISLVVVQNWFEELKRLVPAN